MQLLKDALAELSGQQSPLWDHSVFSLRYSNVEEYATDILKNAEMTFKNDIKPSAPQEGLIELAAAYIIAMEQWKRSTSLSE